MYKLNLDLEYKFKEGQQPPKTKNVEVLPNYIQYAVNQLNPEGLDKSKLRTWGRLQRKFDESIDANKNFVIVDESEKDFISEAMRTAKFPANEAKWILVVEDELHALDLPERKIDLKAMEMPEDKPEIKPDGE